MCQRRDNLRSQGRCKIGFPRIIVAAAFAALCGVPAGAQELTLRMPPDMVASGFDKQILPRFKFKHRVGVTPVTEGEADMAFGDEGARVFRTIGGEEVRLDIATTAPEAELFLDWLRSDPGIAAVESFEVDGAPVYTAAVAVEEVEAEESFDGDTEAGARLALVHCGRCHVIDDRNRMGGIGSTPSFEAMRGRPDWPKLFLAFYAENPHPSFTQVEGVTEPFGPDRQVHIAPVEITLEEIEAITAFVATLAPKELGNAVQSN